MSQKQTYHANNRTKSADGSKPTAYSLRKKPWAPARILGQDHPIPQMVVNNSDWDEPDERTKRALERIRG